MKENASEAITSVVLKRCWSWLQFACYANFLMTHVLKRWFVHFFHLSCYGSKRWQNTSADISQVPAFLGHFMPLNPRHGFEIMLSFTSQLSSQHSLLHFCEESAYYIAIKCCHRSEQITLPFFHNSKFANESYAYNSDYSCRQTFLLLQYPNTVCCYWY